MSIRGARGTGAQRCRGAASGLVLDRLLGEPPQGVHPVGAFGFLMQRVEAGLWRPSRLTGSVHAALGLSVGVGAGRRMRSTTLAAALAVGGRALGRAATRVAAALEAGDLQRARALLPTLAGREPEGLDEKEIVRATVESVAENTVDAIVAPALWAAVAGAPGALGYRAVNTLDAMVGHRDARYERFGWASARADDFAAWAPARATAALVMAVRPRAAPSAWRAITRQAPSHPSPNGGVAEAAFAAALGLRLGGLNRYGDRTEIRPPLGFGRAPERRDIAAAVKLSRDVTWALAGVLAVLGASAGAGRRR
ncbi:MAG: CobD/CbiB family cobalamin biosynthesis protein [Acidimicrobiales bacterium]